VWEAVIDFEVEDVGFVDTEVASGPAPPEPEGIGLGAGCELVDVWNGTLIRRLILTRIVTTELLHDFFFGERRSLCLFFRSASQFRQRISQPRPNRS
jgi:hypothetical protein